MCVAAWELNVFASSDVGRQETDLLSRTARRNSFHLESNI